jgi:hypothetical protein
MVYRPSFAVVIRVKSEGVPVTIARSRNGESSCRISHRHGAARRSFTVPLVEGAVFTVRMMK